MIHASPNGQRGPRSRGKPELATLVGPLVRSYGVGKHDDGVPCSKSNHRDYCCTAVVAFQTYWRRNSTSPSIDLFFCVLASRVFFFFLPLQYVGQLCSKTVAKSGAIHIRRPSVPQERDRAFSVAPFFCGAGTKRALPPRSEARTQSKGKGKPCSDLP